MYTGRHDILVKSGNIVLLFLFCFGSASISSSNPSCHVSNLLSQASYLRGNRHTLLTRVDVADRDVAQLAYEAAPSQKKTQHDRSPLT